MLKIKKIQFIFISFSLLLLMSGTLFAANPNYLDHLLGPLVLAKSSVLQSRMREDSAHDRFESLAEIKNLMIYSHRQLELIVTKDSRFDDKNMDQIILWNQSIARLLSGLRLAFEDSNDEIRLEALNNFEELNTPFKNLLSFYAKRYKKAGKNEQYQISECVQKMSPVFTNLISSISSNFYHPNKKIVKKSRESMLILNEYLQMTHSILKDSVRFKDQKIQQETLETLDSMAPGILASMPLLKRAVKSDDVNVKRDAILALKQITLMTGEMVDALNQISKRIQNQSPLRSTLFFNQQAFDQALYTLRLVSQDSDPAIRKIAADTLKEINVAL